MRRFILGFVIGMLLAGAPVWAGAFKNGPTLMKERGGGCGDSYFYGYVAGGADMLAGFFPATSHKLKDVADQVADHILRAGEEGRKLPASVFVAAALLEMKIIPEEDAKRVIPESWRPELLKQKMEWQDSHEHLSATGAHPIPDR